MRDIFENFESTRLSDPDPVRRAQIQMRAPLPKRFYTKVDVITHGDAYAVALDGKLARTPGKALLTLPTRSLAELVASEFDAQVDVINPVTMPVMRIANTALDGVVNEAEAVRKDIVRFASSDLLCYRAGEPESLVARQNQLWNPVLDWAAHALGTRFALAEGIVHITQPQETIALVDDWLRSRSEPMRLAALHLMTTLVGSALLAIAAEARAISGEDAWLAAHVDEDWQIENWGHDAEAAARRSARRRDFDAAINVAYTLN